ncbi:MAG TPA: serine/threonine protein kinase [Cyanobacteria bacterium UBA8553]|nr:serine/threonine protein kinase [Cyanobacteria bacterium UBA8553]HAJ63186.1 serine/threonine protein kinase [Cyanobacteria bacterium UBA8543]
MEIHCTRPGCPRPQNFFADLDDKATLKTVQQKYCISCGMPLILIGRYIPLRLLGRGGFGAAFLARDRYTPAMRQCVVKQFQPSGDLSPQQLKIAQDLFEREAEVLEQLGNIHPQIPDLFAFFPLTTPSMQPGKQDQFFYLVQEFIDGQDLEEELKTKGKFSEVEALEVLQEILKVLKFVHENGSIHRDIKPSNIMRDRKGLLYLLDFGAVKQVTTGTPLGATPGKSTGIYSMGFAPPEQMSGGQVYPSTDLYALAVTVITLLTGTEPGELYDSYSNQWNWRNYAQVSDTLADVLDRMLLPAPNQRFQSAQDAIDALTLKPTPPPPVQQSMPPTAMPPVSQPPSSQPGTGVSINPQPTAHNIQPSSRQSAFPLLEVLSGAAFTGFEGALLFLALSSLLPSPGLSIGLWGMIMGGLIYAEFRRFIEKFDFLIIAGITLAVVVFFKGLQHGLPVGSIIVISVVAGAGAIAVTAIFRIVYLLLSRFL